MSDDNLSWFSTSKNSSHSSSFLIHTFILFELQSQVIWKFRIFTFNLHCSLTCFFFLKNSLDYSPLLYVACSQIFELQRRVNQSPGPGCLSWIVPVQLLSVRQGSVESVLVSPFGPRHFVLAWNTSHCIVWWDFRRENKNSFFFFSQSDLATFVLVEIYFESWW